MQTAFLFLDECLYDRLDLAALTGVLVPADQYAAVRDEMCRIACECQVVADGTIPPVIELHAVELLTDLANGRDELELHQARLEVFASVVRVVNQYRLRVRRIAYTNRRDIVAAMPLDPN